jgi:Histidine kinase-, DNA gyrase B-, and HSP90-like ATPase
VSARQRQGHRLCHRRGNFLKHGRAVNFLSQCEVLVPEPFFRFLLTVDIGVRRVPSNDAAALVFQGGVLNELPTVFSALLSRAHFQLKRNSLQQSCAAFRAKAINIFGMESPLVSFSVTGDAQEMHPVVRDEIYRVGYEAIRNACTHSRGSRVEVELKYGHDLALRVKDDSVGIDATIEDHPKEGHFGLQGMHERVSRIGGKLTVTSSATSGTEITVVVPGGIIFRDPSVSPLDKIRTVLRKGGPKHPS